MDTGLDVTLKVKAKHAALNEAVRKLGSQSALARHLGIHPSEMGGYCNLSRVPPKTWSQEKRDNIEKKLFDLTGQTLAELFPPELCASKAFLASKKEFEIKRTLPVSAICGPDEERLSLPSACDEAGDAEWHRELKQRLETLIKTLNHREGEVLKMRFGLDGGEPLTLDECASLFCVTKERVRQIECKAIRKIQASKRINQLESLVDVA